MRRRDPKKREARLARSQADVGLALLSGFGNANVDAKGEASSVARVGDLRPDWQS